MQSVAPTSLLSSRWSLHGQAARPVSCLSLSKPCRKQLRQGRPELAVSSAQHQLDALVSQPRLAQPSLEAIASTSSPSESTPEHQTDAAPASWFQRLGLPILKIAATVAVVAALAFGPSGAAMAARSGGRAGGSSFGAARSMGGGSSFGRSMGSSGSPSSYLGGSSTSTLSRGTGLGLGTGSYMSIFGPTYGYGVPVQSTGGGGVGGIVLLAIVAALAISFLPGILSGNSSSREGGDSFGPERVAVSKVQVGLLGSARQLQRDLEKMTRKANTSSPEGLHYLLQETVLALSRNPDYWVYGRGEMQSKRGIDAGEDLFNNISMEERSKFKEETLSNVSGRSSSQRMRRAAPSSAGINELIVVTIIVASQGSMKIPDIHSQEEMRTSLNRLGALRSDQVLAVEVLWTPQDDDDFYTKDEMFADYPTLHNL